MLRCLKATQPLAVNQLRLGQDGGRNKFLNRLSGEIAKRGVIDVLRKGVYCYPMKMTL